MGSSSTTSNGSYEKLQEQRLPVWEARDGAGASGDLRLVQALALDLPRLRLHRGVVAPRIQAEQNDIRPGNEQASIASHREPSSDCR